MRISNDTLITGPADMSQPWTSDAIWCGHISDMSISLEFTGSPEGYFRLQASNDVGSQFQGAYDPNSVENWTNIDGSLQLIDEAGDHTWTITSMGWRWTRVQWVPSAGSGSLITARFNAKGV